MTNELGMHTRRLIDTGPICYIGPEGLTWRPCRSWVTRDGEGRSLVVSVVTEIGPGKSISEGARDVVAGLWEAWGTQADALMVVEHYPADSEPERFAVFEHDGGEFTRSRHLPAGELHALVDEAELIRTDPIEPVPDAVDAFERIKAEYRPQG